MVKAMANKKHLVASFHNLSPELQEEIKQKYPLGFTDAMIRVDKPNGDFLRPAGGGPIPQAEPPRTRMEADRLFRPLLCRERGLRVPVGKAPATPDS